MNGNLHAVDQVIGRTGNNGVTVVDAAGDLDRTAEVSPKGYVAEFNLAAWLTTATWGPAA